nr:MAG TPA: hypothetical protein [Crassvirales sp.]
MLALFVLVLGLMLLEVLTELLIEMLQQIVRNLLIIVNCFIYTTYI